MTGYALQADCSHWQTPVDLGKYPYKRIGLKCTDGASSVDPTYKQRATAAHENSVAVEHYCFAEATDGATQARFLLDNVEWKAGDRLVIDAEVHGVTAKVVKDFINECHLLKPGAAGMVYGSPGFLAPAKIRPSHGWGLWIADVTSAAQPTIPPGWDHWTLWQFSFTETVKGIGGKCDLSRVAPTPKPAPVPKSKHTPMSVLERRRASKLLKALRKRTHGLVDIDQVALGDLGKQIDRVRGLK